MLIIEFGMDLKKMKINVPSVSIRVALLEITVLTKLSASFTSALLFNTIVNL